MNEQVCTECGHTEAHHETYEYRGDKSRHCLFVYFSNSSLPPTRCKCRRFSAEPKTVRVAVDDLKKLQAYVTYWGAADECGVEVNEAVNRLCGAE